MPTQKRSAAADQVPSMEPAPANGKDGPAVSHARRKTPVGSTNTSTANDSAPSRVRAPIALLATAGCAR